MIVKLEDALRRLGKEDLRNRVTESEFRKNTDSVEKCVYNPTNNSHLYWNDWDLVGVEITTDQGELYLLKGE